MHARSLDTPVRARPRTQLARQHKIPAGSSSMPSVVLGIWHLRWGENRGLGLGVGGCFRLLVELIQSGDARKQSRVRLLSSSSFFSHEKTAPQSWPSSTEEFSHFYRTRSAPPQMSGRMWSAAFERLDPWLLTSWPGCCCWKWATGSWQSRAEGPWLGRGGRRPACGEAGKKTKQNQRFVQNPQRKKKKKKKLVAGGSARCYHCSLWTMWATRESEMPGKASSASRMAVLNSSRTKGFPFTCSCLALSWKPKEEHRVSNRGR